MSSSFLPCALVHACPVELTLWRPRPRSAAPPTRPAPQDPRRIPPPPKPGRPCPPRPTCARAEERSRPGGRKGTLRLREHAPGACPSAVNAVNSASCAMRPGGEHRRGPLAQRGARAPGGRGGHGRPGGSARATTPGARTSQPLAELHQMLPQPPVPRVRPSFVRHNWRTGHPGFHAVAAARLRQARPVRPFSAQPSPADGSSANPAVRHPPWFAIQRQSP